MPVPPKLTKLEIESREGIDPSKGQHVEHVDSTNDSLCEARLYLLVTVHKETMSSVVSMRCTADDDDHI
jgi:hypothetical protein